MAFTQTDLDAINEAIASGALKVKYQDREVTYQTFDDLTKARNLILNEIEPARKASGGRRFAMFSKGL